LGEGVKKPLVVSKLGIFVSGIINNFVLPRIQEKLAKVSIEVPKPLVDTTLLLDAGAVTLASNIMLSPMTTTTTTLGPAQSCNDHDAMNFEGACYGGNGLQPCYTCEYWGCTQQGRRRRNRFWSCN